MNINGGEGTDRDASCIFIKCIYRFSQLIA